MISPRKKREKLDARTFLAAKQMTLAADAAMSSWTSEFDEYRKELGHKEKPNTSKQDVCLHLECLRCKQRVAEPDDLKQHEQRLHVSQITEFLFMGNADQSNSIQELKFDSCITAILNVSYEVPNKVVLVYNSLEGNYKHLPIDDTEEFKIINFFEEASKFIEEQRLNSTTTTPRILVHCRAGVSRSATIVIAYLMRYHKYSLLSALTLVRSRRSIVCPNNGFMRQLKEYEHQLASPAHHHHSVS